MPNSPFGAYLRDARVASGKSLREVAEALSISHVYLGEVERGRRRTLQEKYWQALADIIPKVTVPELARHAAASEPLDPATMEGRSRDVVIALARRLEENDMPDDVAARILRILEERERTDG